MQMTRRLTHIDQSQSATVQAEARIQIRLSIFQSMFSILEAMKKLGVEFAGPKAKMNAHRDNLIARMGMSENLEFSAGRSKELWISLEALWADEVLKRFTKKCASIHLTDNAAYFLDRAHLIFLLNYLPSDTDLVRMYWETNGIVSSQFSVQQTLIHTCDLGFGWNRSLEVIILRN